jgi:hypothetical protein
VPGFSGTAPIELPPISIHDLTSVARPKGDGGAEFMNQEMMMLVELLLAGFFAVACIRASVPAAASGKLSLGDLLRFPSRLERLRRTRWQWFSMVAVLLAVRMQTGVPTILEAIVAVQFVLFFALPTRAGASLGKGRSGYEPVLGSR